MKHIYCNCGNEIQIDFPESFNLAQDPDIVNNILDGSFMSVRCEKCETLVKPEIPARIMDKKRGIDIVFRPDTERIQFLQGSLDLPETERVVFGYHELEEKILIFTNDLHDKAIEIVKYFYIKKAGPGKDLDIYLNAVEETALQFRIHGLKEDEIGITKIGKDFYTTIENDLETIIIKENISEAVTPPYVSIKKIYIDEDES